MKKDKISFQAKIIELYSKVFDLKKPYSSEKITKEYIKKMAKINEKEYKTYRTKIKLKEYNIEGYSYPIYKTYPVKDNKKEVILYLHGGGYLEPAIIYHFHFIDRLSINSNLSVVMPMYPKAPHHTYKDGYEYVLAVYHDLINNGYEKIVLMGDSAGGGFALGLAQYLKEKKKTLPYKIVMISPWLDITMSNPEIQKTEKKDHLLSPKGLSLISKAWANGEDLKNYLLSPIYGNIKGLPPMLLICGTSDILCPDSRLLAQKAKEEKVLLTYLEYQRLPHCFTLLRIPEGKESLNKIIEFIK